MIIHIKFVFITAQDFTLTQEQIDTQLLIPSQVVASKVQYTIRINPLAVILPTANDDEVYFVYNKGKVTHTYVFFAYTMLLCFTISYYLICLRLTSFLLSF